MVLRGDESARSPRRTTRPAAARSTRSNDVDVEVRRGSHARAGRRVGQRQDHAHPPAARARDRRRPATWCSRASRSPGSPAGRPACATATPSPPCSRTRTARSTRGMRIWEAITEQQAIEKVGSKQERRDRAEELLDLVGPQRPGGRRATRTSCRVASASASPSPGPSSQDPEVDHPRRAAVGARRLGQRADRQPAARPAGAPRRHLRLRRPRPAARAPPVPRRRRDVPGQDRRVGPGRRGARSRPPTRTRRRSSPRRRSTSLAITDDADTQGRRRRDDSVGCPYRIRCPHRDDGVRRGDAGADAIRATAASSAATIP